MVEGGVRGVSPEARLDWLGHGEMGRAWWLVDVSSGQSAR